MAEPERRDRALRAVVEGRVVLVTGASSGIGRAIAVRVGAAGGTVALLARRRDVLEEVAEEIAAAGGVATVHPCDLVSEAARAATVTEVLDAHDHVDVLVNNAGHSIRRTVAESVDRPDDLERLLQINTIAPVRLVQLLLPRMIERQDGHVINISSMAAQAAPPRFAAYTATKSALDAYTRCAASELRGDGIAFTTINMPLVRTPMIAPSKESYRGMPSLSAEKAAGSIAQAIIHRPARIATPVGELMALGNLLNPSVSAAAQRVGGAGASRARTAAGRIPGPVGRLAKTLITLPVKR